MYFLKKDKILFTIFDVLSIIVATLFLIGVNFWFHSCDSGHACEEVEKLISILAIFLIVVSTIKLLIPDKKFKIGLSFTNVVVSLIALVSINVLKICMSEMMHCVKYMQPWTIVFSTVFIALSIFEILFIYFNLNNESTNYFCR